MNKLLSFAVLLVLVFSCDSVEWDEPEMESAFCFSERETVAILKDINGIIKKLGNDHYVIESNTSEQSLLLGPCNLPADYKQDNLSIIFSGKQKEIFANEKWAAMPFELIKIKKGTAL